MRFKSHLRWSRYACPGLLVLSALLCWESCKTVRPWQRSYLNDDAMQIGKRPLEKFSTNVHTYREAASGGGKAKGSGGCGCN
jgi:hypothetical protein